MLTSRLDDWHSGVGVKATAAGARRQQPHLRDRRVLVPPLLGQTLQLSSFSVRRRMDRKAPDSESQRRDVDALPAFVLPYLQAADMMLSRAVDAHAPA